MREAAANGGRRIATALVAAVPLLGLTCGGPRPSAPTGTLPSEQSRPTGSRIVIGPEQHDQIVPARIHDTLVVNLGRPGSGWRVEFDRQILEHVGPASLGTPAADGWSFRCVGAGTSDLVFTAPAVPCPSGAPCPPSSFEFHTRVDVKE